MREERSEKDKFYKKWWFWVIIVILAVVSVGYNQSNKDEDGAEDAALGQVDEKVDLAEGLEAGSKEWLEAKVGEILSEEQLIGINYADYNDNFALIKFNGDMSLTSNMTVRGMYGDIFNILKNIQDGVIGDVDFNVVYPLTDKYGNDTDTIVIKASFKKETIKKINFDKVSYKNLADMADDWWSHPSATLDD